MKINGKKPENHRFNYMILRLRGKNLKAGITYIKLITMQIYKILGRASHNRDHEDETLRFYLFFLSKFMDLNEKKNAINRLNPVVMTDVRNMKIKGFNP